MNLEGHYVVLRTIVVVILLLLLLNLLLNFLKYKETLKCFFVTVTVNRITPNSSTSHLFVQCFLIMVDTPPDSQKI